MSKLIFSAHKIIDQNDFKIAEDNAASGKQIYEHFQKTVAETLDKQMGHLKPGSATDGSKALEISVIMTVDPGQKVSMFQFGKGISGSLIKIFGQDQFLSCIIRERTSVDKKTKGLEGICVVLPMEKRRISADAYLDKRDKSKISQHYQVIIEQDLKRIFPEIVTAAEEKVADPTSLGYQEALIKFKCPRPKIEDNKERPWYTPEIDTQVQSEIPYDQLKEIMNDALARFTTGADHMLFVRTLRNDPDVTPQIYMEKIEEYIKGQHPRISDHDMEIILNQIYKAVYQNYLLEPLINDDQISDIKVLAPDRIRVKVGGDRFTSNLKFMNAVDYYWFIESLAERNHLDIHGRAINVFSDTKSNDKFRMRFNITTPYINSSEYPYLHIRKISKQKRGMDYLLKAGMLDVTLANYLIDRCRNGRGMIFCGKGASGKTTLMNCLLDYIPFNKSGLVIQESDELFSDVHPDLMFQHIVQNVGTGMPTYDLQDEARNGLLTDLDYFIIGEVKGAEAKYFINAADTGHKCWCSVHSPSSLDAIDKLADYVMYETKYSKEEATYMLKDLGTIIFMQNFKVFEISEISGWDFERKELIYTPIYRRPIIPEQ